MENCKSLPDCSRVVEAHEHYPKLLQTLSGCQQAHAFQDQGLCTCKEHPNSSTGVDCNSPSLLAWDISDGSLSNVISSTPTALCVQWFPSLQIQDTLYKL